MPPLIGLAAHSTVSASTSRTVAAVSQVYVDAVATAGGVPLLLPIQSSSAAPEVVGVLDGLVLCGGGDVDPARSGAGPGTDLAGVDAARDDWELGLTAAARTLGIPVLGVCRGTQVLNVAGGGTLIGDVRSVTGMDHRDLDRQSEAVHDIRIEPDSVLAELCRGTKAGVNTIHHQAVAEVGEWWRPVAWAADGTVEAIESTSGWAALGVQWHPELLVEHPDPGVRGPQRALFSWLVRRALDVRAAAGEAPRR